MTFGEQVREWRIERKLNQRDLAARIGIDFTYLSKIENDRMPPPTDGVISKIALALEKDVATLLHLAFKVPEDLKPIITSSREAPALLRAINGLSDAEVRFLIDKAEQVRLRGIQVENEEAEGKSPDERS